MAEDLEQINRQMSQKQRPLGLYLAMTVLPALGLTALPAFIVCLIELVKIGNRKYSLLGILITVFSLALLFFLFITVTPPGLLPYPLEHYKFRRACRDAAFWLDYKTHLIADVKSINTFILVRHGAILYQGGKGEFQIQEIIDLAQANDWTYHLDLPMFREDFEKYYSSFSEEDYALADIMCYFFRSPILIEENCIALTFETGNIHGYASFVFISEDGSRMVVYYDSPSVPNPAMKFRLPFGFEELRDRRIGKSDNLSGDTN